MRRIRRFALTALLGMATLPAAFLADSGGLAYPPARQGDVVDDYHGVKIPDPYRWMEDLDGAETRAWVAAENAVTSRYLEQLSLRETFKRRITELWNYPKVSLPFREAGSLFYRKNSGLQRQSAFYRRPSPEGEAKLLVDPNVLFPDGSSSRRGPTSSNKRPERPTAFGSRSRPTARQWPSPRARVLAMLRLAWMAPPRIAL